MRPWCVALLLAPHVRSDEDSQQGVLRWGTDRPNRPHIKASTVDPVTRAQVEIHVTPDTVDSGDDVILAWNPIANASWVPRSSDWIGFYCGTNLSVVGNHLHLDRNYISSVSGWQDGNSSTTVRINSLRMPFCEFRMFTFDNQTHYHNIGISNTFRVWTWFEHRHLALTGNSDEMMVLWTATVANAFVEYAHADDAWDSRNVRKKTGACHTYNASDMCLPPATSTLRFVEPGMLCEAVLTGLTPDKVYKYRVSSADGKTVSSSEKFRAAANVDSDYGFAFLVYGDMGTFKASRLTARLCTQEIQHGVRMVHHLGDLSYARGKSYVWDVWMSMIEPYAKIAPYMIGVGNRDFDYPGTETNSNDPSGDEHFNPVWFNADSMHSKGECGVPTVKRFHMPAESSGGNGVFWHSYDFGSLHTVVLSSEHRCGPGSNQYAWLQRDLATVDRSRTPWVIVEMHRPMYNNEKHFSDYVVALGLQIELEELLVRYNVDLVLAGHYHSYLRTKRIYKDKANEKLGIYYFTIGSAGYPLDDADLYRKDWVGFVDHSFGVGRVTIANSSAMHWEFIRTDDCNDAGTLVDETWIRKREPAWQILLE